MLQLNLTNAGLRRSQFRFLSIRILQFRIPNHTIRAYFNSQLGSFAKNPQSRYAQANSLPKKPTYQRLWIL